MKPHSCNNYLLNAYNILGNYTGSARGKFTNMQGTHKLIVKGNMANSVLGFCLGCYWNVSQIHFKLQSCLPPA